jgi:hypothetical protein
MTDTLGTKGWISKQREELLNFLVRFELVDVTGL